MELLIVILVMGILLFIRGSFTEKKKLLEKRQEFLNQFGKRRKAIISPQRYQNLRKYCDLAGYEHGVDAITWNDLGMDQVFEQMDANLSSCGEERLYLQLHKQDIPEHILQRRGLLADFFTNQQEIRLDCQMALYELGFMGKYSLRDYLDYLTSQNQSDALKDIVLDILYIPLLILLLFYPIVGGALLLLLMFVNIYIYLQTKRKMEPYLAGVGYLVRLAACTENLKVILRKQNVPMDEADLKAMEEAGASLQKLRMSGNYVLLCNQRSAGGNSGSNPLELLFSYLNMLFHFDQIRYKQLLCFLSNKKADIEILMDVIGEIDLCISIASFRKSLKSGYCEPIFISDEKKLLMEDAYHPMLKKPVGNSFSLEHGILLTGSNASGKSTFLRTVAINTILAQTINTCSAQHYEGHRFFVYSSIALTDNLAEGESYFLVEIKSIKRILDAAEEGIPVLCFVDEVLRGTNTVERIAASSQLLLAFSEMDIRCIAATHDLELTDLLSEKYMNFHFQETVNGDDVSFTYEMLPGPAVSRNAILLLKQMGFPEGLTSSAENLARTLDEQRRTKVY